MNRTYDVAWYKERIDSIYKIIPDCTVSSDIITGFCSETEEDHQDTLRIMDYANFSLSYMFYYSERPGTLAARKYPDDISLEIKKRRLSEVVDKQHQIAERLNKADIGKVVEVLIEGDSKKSTADFKGRNPQNKMVIFPKTENFEPGDYVNVLITESSSATLIGHIVN
jgi:tRNA-2-methylthio-N6-dimethylallyladenosine synthase